MAGLAELFLGAQNPFAQFANTNRNALGAIGAGLGSGVTFGEGLGNAAQMLPQGRTADDAYATAQKAEAERTAQLNQTMEYLRAKAPQYFEAVQAGVLTPADAYSQSIKDAMGQSKPAPIEINGQLVDPTTYQVIGDFRTQEQPKPTSSMQEYEFARKQGYQGTFQDYELEQKRAGATNIDFNQNQGQAAAFADRMATANAILEDPKLTAAQTDMAQVGLSGVPILGNMLTSEERKMAEQAQRDFVNAILRRESGAVISPSEFDNAAKQYFPQPGDTPAVIEQKRQNRVLAIQGVSRAAGPSYVPPPKMTESGVMTTSTGVPYRVVQ